jgi:hypothetical protein
LTSLPPRKPNAKQKKVGPFTCFNTEVPRTVESIVSCHINNWLSKLDRSRNDGSAVLVLSTSSHEATAVDPLQSKELELSLIDKPGREAHTTTTGNPEEDFVPAGATISNVKPTDR